MQLYLSEKNKLAEIIGEMNLEKGNIQAECSANRTVNLSTVEGVSHPELFQAVAKVIADDTLENINAHDEKVTPRISFYSQYGKRALDILLSSVAVVITLPVNLVLLVCTYFDVGRPVFFMQKRVGRNGKLFNIVKFRNMTNDTDENGVLLPSSQRVTKFGSFVRKNSLDELLNFYSVLKGDMSLIGPRPLAIEYLDRYSDRHRMRYAVKPGLECPLLHKIDRKITWKEQFENDIYYVENVSFSLDVKMAFALVEMVFNRKSSTMRGKAIRGSFMGYYPDGSSINAQTVPFEYYEKALALLGYSDNEGKTDEVTVSQ